jgi:hypothetical protein
MNAKLQKGFVGVTIILIGALVLGSGASPAQSETDHKKAIQQIADAIKNGKGVVAKKLAAKAAADVKDLADLMHLYRPEKRGGFGLEIGLRQLVKMPNAKIGAKFGSLSAAMAEVILAKAPIAGPKGKNPKAWAGFAQRLRNASADLEQAARKKNAKAIQAAAVQINDACVGCHSIFKE